MFLLVGGIKWINVKVVRSSEEDSNKRVLFLIFIFFFVIFEICHRKEEFKRVGKRLIIIKKDIDFCG